MAVRNRGIRISLGFHVQDVIMQIGDAIEKLPLQVPDSPGRAIPLHAHRPTATLGMTSTEENFPRTHSRRYISRWRSSSQLNWPDSSSMSSFDDTKPESAVNLALPPFQPGFRAVIIERLLDRGNLPGPPVAGPVV